jgi:hypothetical protein
MLLLRDPQSDQEFAPHSQQPKPRTIQFGQDLPKAGPIYIRFPKIVNKRQSTTCRQNTGGNAVPYEPLPIQGNHRREATGALPNEATSLTQ